MLKIYSDGSAAPNPGYGGAAAIALDEDKLVWVWTHYEEDTTNNRMEMKAAIAAIKYANEHGFALSVYCDSAYVVNLYNDWMLQWQRANWTRKNGKPIENLDLVKEMYNLHSSSSCTLKKIKGHSGEVGNEICDALATKNPRRLEKLLLSENISEENECLSMFYENL